MCGDLRDFDEIISGPGEEGMLSQPLKQTRGALNQSSMNGPTHNESYGTSDELEDPLSIFSHFKEDTLDEEGSSNGCGMPPPMADKAAPAKRQPTSQAHHSTLHLPDSQNEQTFPGAANSMAVPTHGADIAWPTKVQHTTAISATNCRGLRIPGLPPLPVTLHLTR